MMIQVHDELVFDVPQSELEETKALIMHEMEHAAKLRVPLKVDVVHGKSWFKS
jgi:DNA polymerase-1